MRLLVYTDYAYHRVGDTVLSERAFSLFLARVAASFAGTVVVLGRLSPSPDGGKYAIGDGVEFVPLPWYESLTSRGAVVGIARSLRAGWQAVGSVDRVWLLGPHPLIIVLAAFAVLRRKRLILGVRQDFPAYIASRHPHSRLLRRVAGVLEHAFRAIARRSPTIVVGPELAANYAASRELLEISVSLVEADRIVSPAEAATKDYSGHRTILSVGRLDAEKNPIMLVDVARRLTEQDDGWRMAVCGEGPLAGELAAAVERSQLTDEIELAGYVPFGPELEQRYRSAHVLLHSSWTEGLPQVILEAFAAGLPVVASDVGGIAAAVGDAAIMVRAGDAAAAAAAVRRIADDESLRRRLIAAGHAFITAHTLEVESERVARFLEG